MTQAIVSLSWRYNRVRLYLSVDTASASCQRLCEDSSLARSLLLQLYSCCFVNNTVACDGSGHWSRTVLSACTKLLLTLELYVFLVFFSKFYIFEDWTLTLCIKTSDTNYAVTGGHITKERQGCEYHCSTNFGWLNIMENWLYYLYVLGRRIRK